MKSEEFKYLLNDLWAIYIGLIEQGIYVDRFGDWVESIRFYHKTETGGITLHEVNPAKPTHIWYVNLYCPKSMPSMRDFRTVIMASKLMGCECIEAFAHNIRVQPILRKLGFKEVSNRFYRLKLN